MGIFKAKRQEDKIQVTKKIQEDKIQVTRKIQEDKVQVQERYKEQEESGKYFSGNPIK